MISRIMAVGRGRFVEAACSLSFDNNFQQPIDKTYIILPADKETFFETIKFTYISQVWDYLTCNYIH